MHKRRLIQWLTFVIESGQLTHTVEKHHIDTVDKLRQLDNQRQHASDLKLNFAFFNFTFTKFFTK
jgi:hypothetical protein